MATLSSDIRQYFPGIADSTHQQTIKSTVQSARGNIYSYKLNLPGSVTIFYLWECNYLLFVPHSRLRSDFKLRVPLESPADNIVGRNGPGYWQWSWLCFNAWESRADLRRSINGTLWTFAETEESYASDRGGELSRPEMLDTMMENWVGIEDDPAIQESEIEEVLKELEVGKEEDIDDDANSTRKDPMVVDDSDSDDNYSSLGFQSHLEIEEAFSEDPFIRQKEKLPKESSRSYRKEYKGDNEGDASSSSDKSKGSTRPSIMTFFKPVSAKKT
jgi:hypothetical protein